MGFKADEILFIVNPHSGKRSPHKVMKNIRKLNPEYRIYISDSISKFHDFIEENLEKYNVFVVAGGDGAINMTASYLFDRKDKILAIIPTGSGNGFARENGFTIDLFRLQKALEKGETFFADGMEINGRKFINMAGVGFDAYVAHTFAKRKKRGLWNYGIATLQCLAKFKPMYVRINIDEKEIEGNFSMITMANTRQFGNNAIIAPKAHSESGKLDLVMVKPFPFYYYPIFILNMFTGKIRQSRYVDYLRIENDFSLETFYTMYHVDGEPLFIDGKSEVKIFKGALNILKMR